MKYNAVKVLTLSSILTLMNYKNMNNSSTMGISPANITYSVILSFILGFGMFGNTFVLWFGLDNFLKFQKRQRRFYYLPVIHKLSLFCLPLIQFHFHLSLINILLLCTIPFRMIEMLTENWILFNTSCKLQQGIVFLNYLVSLSFLLIKIIYNMFVGHFSKWKNHKRFINRQYLVLGRICDSPATVAMAIASSPNPLCDDEEMNRESAWEKLTNRNKKRKILKLSKTYALIPTIVIYIVSVLIALPIFVYGEKNSQELCGCNIFYFEFEKEVYSREKLVMEFPTFNFDCLTKTCFTKQNFLASCNASENFFQNYETSTSNTNANHTILKRSDKFVTFDSTRETSVINFTVYEYFDRAISERSCIQSLRETTSFYTFYRWFNFCSLFFAMFVVLVSYEIRVKSMRRDAIQAFRNKPKILRNHRKLNISIAQNEKELQKDLYSHKELITTIIVFATCWFLYNLFEVIKLFLSFILSERECRIFTNVAMIMVYFNAVINPYLLIFLKNRTSFKKYYNILEKRYYNTNEMAKASKTQTSEVLALSVYTNTGSGVRFNAAEDSGSVLFMIRSMMRHSKVGDIKNKLLWVRRTLELDSNLSSTVKISNLDSSFSRIRTRTRSCNF